MTLFITKSDELWARARVPGWVVDELLEEHQVEVMVEEGDVKV